MKKLDVYVCRFSGKWMSGHAVVFALSEADALDKLVNHLNANEDPDLHQSGKDLRGLTAELIGVNAIPTGKRDEALDPDLHVVMQDHGDY